MYIMYLQVMCAEYKSLWHQVVKWLEIVICTVALLKIYFLHNAMISLQNYCFVMHFVTALFQYAFNALLYVKHISYNVYEYYSADVFQFVPDWYFCMSGPIASYRSALGKPALMELLTAD